MVAVVRKIYRAAADIFKVFSYTKVDFRTRVEVAKALLQLKFLRGPDDQKGETEFTFFQNKMSVFHPGDVQFMIKEIWLEDPYRVRSKKEIQRIVDVGANQGFTFLYFKQQHPKAAITAIEPDPHNFRILEQNTKELKTGSDIFIQKAAWNKDTVLYFEGDTDTPSTNRSFAEGEEKPADGIPAFDFATWVATANADVVKVDIEGAEAEVMDAVIAAGVLGSASHWFVEFHTERFGKAVHHRVRDAFMAAGFGYEKRGIIGYFFRQGVV